MIDISTIFSKLRLVRFITARPFRSLTAILVIAISIISCTTPSRTMQKKEILDDDEYRYEVIQTTSKKHMDDAFLAATFSGGGMRAATLAYGVIKAIRDTTVYVSDENIEDKIPNSLINEIDFVTSVSGGSVAAAYWALNGPDEVSQLEKDFLDEDIQQQLWSKLFNPKSLIRLPTSSYSRIEILSDIFENLFGEATYNDLINETYKYGDRPYLVLNASDMTTGSLFPFIQLQFDLLCADLNGFKIADAVAASAAYPVVFPALTLRNYRSDDALCYKQALETTLDQKLEIKRKLVDHHKENLDSARDSMRVKKIDLMKAKDRVRTQENVLVRAQEQVKIQIIELDRVNKQIEELKKSIKRAESRVTGLQSDLRNAKTLEDEQDEKRRNALEKEKDEEKEREAKERTLLESIQDIETQIRQAEKDGKTKLGEMLLRLLKKQIGELGGHDKATLDAEPSEAQQQAQKPSKDDKSILEKISQLIWKSYDPRRPDEITKENNINEDDLVTEDNREEFKVISTPMEDQAQHDFAIKKNRMVQKAEKAHNRLEVVKIRFAELSDRFEMLASEKETEEKKQEDEKMISSIKVLKQDIDGISIKINQLDEKYALTNRRRERSIDAFAFAWKQLERQLPEVNQNLYNISKRLTDLEKQLNSMNIHIMNLEQISDNEKLRKIVSELENILKDKRTDLKDIRAEHTEEREKSQQYQQELKEELDRAQRRVKELNEDLTHVEGRLEAIKEEGSHQLKEVSKRKQELQEAKARQHGEKETLEEEKKKIRHEETLLKQAREDTQTWEDRSRRIESLQTEHARFARYFQSQISHYGRDRTQYVHLFDGGAADNLGFTPLLELLDSFFPINTEEVTDEERQQRIKHVGVIVVDARSEPRKKYEEHETPPDLFDTIFTTVGNAIDSKSFLLAKELERITEKLESDGVISERFIVNVGFDNILDFETDSQRDEIDLMECRRAFQNIPTNWNLFSYETNALIALGEALVRGSSTYRDLVGKYDGEMVSHGDSVVTVCENYLRMLEKKERKAKPLGNGVTR